MDHRRYLRVSNGLEVLGKGGLELEADDNVGGLLMLMLEVTHQDGECGDE